jgi:hypothetical protein
MMRHLVRGRDQSLEAVSIAERWVDGQATAKELEAVRQYCYVMPPGNVWSIAHESAWNEAFAASDVAATRFLSSAEESAIGMWKAVSNAAHAIAMTEQCILLRDILGNPFRPVALDPAWRTPAVLHLARAIYDDRAFDQLPVLADALEEAGCASREVLDHCRSPGPHVRGCWVVDLVLGKG